MTNAKRLTNGILTAIWISIVCALIAFLLYMFTRDGLVGIIVGFLLFLAFGGDLLLMLFYPGGKSEDSKKHRQHSDNNAITRG